MKILIITLLSLSFISCSSISKLTGGGPDFKKAFPDRDLVLEDRDNADPTSEAYWYLTDSTFDVAKEDFEKFLGNKWVGMRSNPEQNKELTKIVAKDDKTLLVEGSAIYYSSKFPGRQVGLMQINKFPTTKLLFIYDDKP